MLLALTLSRPPATDLGYLLSKHPARLQSFPLSFGQAHVFYPEATPERCTASLLLDIEPTSLVRTKPGGFPLEHYVNDRPYVASSFLSVAMGSVFSSAFAGRCGGHPELAEQALPLQAELTSVPARGGESLLRRLFEPLGYQLQLTRLPLDESFPEWGDSPYWHVRVQAEARLRDLLAHLYVLLPVLDDEKHYYVGSDEVEKLLRRGAGWLKEHPERELIASRYLKHQGSLRREALARLREDLPDEQPPTEQVERLHDQRLQVVLDALKASGASSVLDLGCGEGRLLQVLLKEKTFQRIVGVDVSSLLLERAAERLRLERMSERQRQRLTLRLGSLVYRDRALEGFDAAAVVEVVEHLDPHRLTSFERCLFEFARPNSVVLTTPNRDYNVLWPALPAGKVRHGDHRFEWSRCEFAAWAGGVAERHGYRVELRPIGDEDAVHGAPTQMGIFQRDH